MIQFCDRCVRLEEDPRFLDTCGKLRPCPDHDPVPRCDHDFRRLERWGNTWIVQCSKCGYRSKQEIPA